MKKFVLILSMLLLSVATFAQKGALSNDFFYFDNPDGTIESYPEYIDAKLQNRAMSISSSKYRQPFMDVYDGPYQDVFNLLFGQKTRTHVFVLSGGQAAARPTVSMVTTYSSLLAGLFAGLWDEFQAKCAKAGPVLVVGNYKDGLSTSKPEECMFMGCEAIHWVTKVDMSKSPFMVAVGAPIQFIFEQYCYYEPKLDKTVGVVFQYTDVDLNAPVSDDIKVYSAALNILRDFTGWGEGKNKNANVEPFKRCDMIEYFKQHFHLKSKAETEEKECNEPPKIFYVEKKIRYIVCGDTIDMTELIKEKEKKKYKGGVKQDEKDSSVIKDPIIPTLPRDPIYDPKPKKPEPKPIEPGIEPDAKRGGSGSEIFEKYAALSLPQGILRPTAENNAYIFFLESNWSPTNAVVAINKQDGRVRDYVPSKQVAARGTIQYIGAYGSDLYLAVEGKGIVKYGQNSVEASTVVVPGDCEENGEKASIIFSPNGRYMAAVGSECSVYDVQNGYKRVKHVSYDDIIGAILTNDGDLFRLIGSTLYIARNNGNETSQEEIDLYNLFNAHPVGISLVGDNMYIMGGGVVAVSNVKQIDWRRGPQLQDNLRFNQCGYISDRGVGVAGVLGGGTGRIAFFSHNNKEHPVTPNSLTTDVKNKYGENIKVNYIYGAFVDSKGNYWLKTDERNFVIYNPDYIKGYDTLQGRYYQYNRK